MILYAMQSEYTDQYLTKLENATPEEKALALERFGDVQTGSLVSREDGSNIATLTIEGPLTPTGPSPLARYFGFGGTGYKDIISAVREIRNDSSIEKTRMIMNTPGGTVEGMDESRQELVLLAAEKPLTAENHGMIASAGYYLATAAESIKAMSPLAVTGSIGVVIAGLDFSEALAQNGIRKVKIVSKNAPNKQADPSTEKGRDILQEQINAMERVFTRTVSEGRNTTDEDVIANFGKGGMLIAKDPDDDTPDALSVGMLDSVVIGAEIITNNEGGDLQIEASVENPDNLGYNSEAGKPTEDEGSNALDITTALGGENNRSTNMDFKTLKAEHPSVFDEAVAVGCAQERDRVEAHITMGEAAGDVKMALDNIKAGADLTPAINAKYMAAGMNANAIAARDDDNVDDIDTSAAADVDTVDDAVSAKLAELTGVDNG